MLRAKGKVTLKGLPPWVEGDWYVFKVNHHYTRLVRTANGAAERHRSTYRTKFEVTR
jgi:hypothetical protein